MKNFAIFLAFFAFFGGEVLASSFVDMPEDHQNYKAVEYLKEKGILDGYSDGTFRPGSLVNRAEAVKIIVGAFGISKDGSFSQKFPDVKSSDWFFKFVMAGEKAGLVSGYSDGKYKPEKTVNLAETLKILTSGAKVTLPEVLTDVFVDVKLDVWYAPHALYAKTKNVVLSDDNGNLNAGKDMTRGDFAEVVYRMMIVMGSNGQAFPLHTSWPYFESDLLPFKMKYDSSKWLVIENKDEIVFWRPNSTLKQFSPGRVYPNSAVVRVTLDPNGAKLTSGKYFENIRNVFAGSDYAFTNFQVNGLNAMEVLGAKEHTADWYLYLGDSTVLAVYTEYGDGVLAPNLQQFIKSMLQTLEYQKIVPITEENSKLLSDVLAVVLVEGKGKQMLDKISDKVIIETDSIGVGTGPVDYYYSKTLNYTFKYERAADTILAARKGQTTTF